MADLSVLSVRLLGGFGLAQDGEPLPPIASRVGRSLFAYLVVNRRRRHRRTELVGVFWPDLPESRGRRRLSHTLWQIQDSLSEAMSGAYLDTDTDSLQFNTAASYWLDVEDFERSLGVTDTSGVPTVATDDLSALRRAVELYRGEFLSGYYDDWVQLEQERLSQLYLGALTRIVDLAKARSDYEEALTAARRVTSYDPIREDMHREVMRMCVLLGRTSEALVQFDRCRSVLREELGAEPSAPTLRLAERIRRRHHGGRGALPGGGSDADDFRPDVGLVGRHRERSVLVDRLEDALTGQGAAVLIEGGPGIGKTRLLTETAEDAVWRGFNVLWGAATPGGTSRPYDPIVRLLDDALSPLRIERLAHRLEPVWLAAAAPLLPALARDAGVQVAPAASGVDGDRLVRESLLRILVALAQSEHSLLVLEDLQWADEESLALLEALAERLRRAPIVLALTYRDTEARERRATWDAIRAVDRACRPARMALPPFTAFETAELARSAVRGRALSPSLLSALHRETGGNPLFVLETLRAAHDAGRLDEVEERPLPVAATVTDLLADRLDRLPLRLREVVDTCSVASEPLALDVLTGALDRDRGDVVDAVLALVRRGVLDEGAEGVTLDHEQLRRVAYEALDDDTRAALHRAVGAALERVGDDDPERLAHHFASSDDPRRALPYLLAAAHRAEEVHGYRTAAEHYRRAMRALDQAPVSVSRRAEVLFAAEQVFDVLGARDEQRRALDDLAVLAAGEPVAEGRTLRRRALLLATTDRFAEAERAARRALRLAQDRPSRGAARQILGMVLRWAGQAEAAAAELEIAVAELAADGDEADAQFALATVLHELQRYEEGLEALASARRTYAADDDRVGLARAAGELGTVLMERGDAPGAVAAYREAIESAHDVGFLYGEGINLANLAYLLQAQGQIDEALRTYDEAVSTLEAVGHRRGVAMAWVNAAEGRHVYLGQDARARADATAALEHFRDVGDDRKVAVALTVLARIALRAGDHEHAATLLEEAEALVADASSAWYEVQVRLALAELALQRGHLDAAERACASASRCCADYELPDFAALVAGVEARLRLQQGRVDDAVATARRAVAAIGHGTERPYLLEATLARALAAAGREQESVEVLSRAADALRDLLDRLPEPLAAGAAEVPEHRDLLEAWQATQPVRVSVQLARADAPTGRALRDDEVRTVVLTLETPEDRRAREGPARRRRQLLRLLSEAAEQSAEPTIGDLAALLDVSEATVRRDLRALRESGEDAPTRGTRAV